MSSEDDLAGMSVEEIVRSYEALSARYGKPKLKLVPWEEALSIVVDQYLYLWNVEPRAREVLIRLKDAEAENRAEILRLICKNKLRPGMVLSAVTEAAVWANADIKQIVDDWRAEQERLEKSIEEHARIVEAVGPTLWFPDAEKARQFVPLARWWAEFLRKCQAGNALMFPVPLKRRRKGEVGERLRFCAFLVDFFERRSGRGKPCISLVAAFARAIYPTDAKADAELHEQIKGVRRRATFQKKFDGKKPRVVKELSQKVRIRGRKN